MTQCRVLSALLIVLLAGCGRRIDLEPVWWEQHHVPADFDAAITSVGGVRVVAEEDEPEGIEVPAELVPILVRVHNGSPAPIRVDPARFALVDSTGRRHAPVPLADVSSKLEQSADASRLAAWSLPGEVGVGGYAEGLLVFDGVDSRSPRFALQLELESAATSQPYRAVMSFRRD